MKLYHFANPRDYRFARAGRLGTWAPDPAWTCPECGVHNQERVYPLIMEWLPDSDQVGDFTWPGLNDEVVVTQHVREAFERNFRGFEFRPFQMYQAPKLKRPEQSSRRRKPRVWLPYEGPPLWDMQATAWCSLDHERSGVRLEKVCSVCERPIYHYPPYEKEHLVVDRETWGGEDIFRIREYSGGIFCTERVKELVEAEGFTNAGFRLNGEFPDFADAGHRPLGRVASRRGAPAPVSAGRQTEHRRHAAAPAPDASRDRRTLRNPPAPLVLKDGRTICYEDLPEEMERLARLEVDFPELPADQTQRYGEFEEELVEYMDLEGEEIDRDDLKFLRSAWLNDQQYWIWEVMLPNDDRAYATACLRGNEQTVGYDTDWHGLSPEQFLLATYFNCL